MSIGKVSEYPDETVGMIRARNWSYTSTAVLTGAMAAIFDWRMAFFFLALAWTISLEVKRVRVALWNECYHAMRLTMDEHGFQFDAEPQIYGKREAT